MRNIRGFTLIELLVVIAIISILVVIVVVALNPVKLINQARDSKKRSDLQQIKSAMQLFYNDCKVYPSTLPTGVWDENDFSGTCDTGSTYMKLVPTDGGNPYLYAVSPSGCTTNCTSYTVGANLSEPNADDNRTLTACSSPVPSGTHNYRVCND